MKEKQNVINDKSNNRTGNIVCTAIKMLYEEKKTFTYTDCMCKCMHIQQLDQMSEHIANGSQFHRFNACAL